MIRDLHNQLVAGEVTATKLAEQYLRAIEEKDGDIGAYLTTLRTQALEAASLVDARLARGESIDLLAGIPGAIKDNICVAGVRATAGSKILDNYIAPYDATVIEKLKARGAVIVGKTNMDEFAMGSSTESSAYRKTKNPVDTERVPGGSSGGSAAAVAAGEAVWSLGSDTGGSIRQPASFCGLVGLKPTYGRVSRFGLIAMASSLDQIGPFGTSVEDVAIVFSRIAGSDAHDATTAESGNGKPFEDYLTGDIRGLSIGVPKEYFSDTLDPRVRAAADQAIERFKELGATIKEISLPHSIYALAVYYILMPSEVSSNLARFDGIKYGLRVNDAEDSMAGTSTLLETYLDTRRVGFGAEVKRRVMLGTYALSAGYYDAYYKKAQKVRALIRQDFEAAFEDVDLIFSPTTPEPAFRFGEKGDDPLKMYLSDIYTVTANLAGVPAISFPMGTIAEDGKELPLGGQLMGRWFDEETVLRAADAFEKQTAKK
ncbi:MAG: aspartyl/glutamyl-tRNA amidotransferase subunit A [Candidatus Moranbacteria bacterium RIFCSPHIGHO2_12_FULL_54_9]|nr:MAG: aspartyl/glutamyl-tRNA amidotransferase subunit A [Candidatus Moranbacteria bacterium RIFCSPHIGHO2_01_FULL_54_31]OGI24931.1 MAG: aspartyl/glutamyl-tRNA amidotransferase subunit A [Candidatus Moranbacteria bacterium RIFCSPHIGHO2_12_FULL_54_9]